MEAAVGVRGLQHPVASTSLGDRLADNPRAVRTWGEAPRVGEAGLRECRVAELASQALLGSVAGGGLPNGSEM